MVTSSNLSSAISTLLPRIKTFWQQSSSLLLTFICAVLSHVRITIDTLGLIFKSILRQVDQLIDYLAHHPLLDKIESMYQETRKKLTLFCRSWNV